MKTTAEPVNQMVLDTVFESIKNGEYDSLDIARKTGATWKSVDAAIQ